MSDNILNEIKEINDEINSGIAINTSTPLNITNEVLGSLNDPVSTDETSETTTGMSYLKGIIAQNKEYPKPMSATYILQAGSVVQTVKSSAGWVIGTNSGILGDVKIMNGDTEVWANEDYNGLAPFYCNTSIKLKSETGGVVNIIYL